MSAEETTTDELLGDMLWSRRRARRLRRHLGVAIFAGHAAVAAVIQDHDERWPEAPGEGPERVLSIARHALELVREIRDEPERFTAAAGLEAQRHGRADPALLVHASRVLAWLPTLATATAAARRR